MKCPNCERYIDPEYKHYCFTAEIDYDKLVGLT